MNVSGEVQMGVDEGGVISRTINSSGVCRLLTLRKRLPVLLGYGRSVTTERNSSPVKTFRLVGQTSETRNPD